MTRSVPASATWMAASKLCARPVTRCSDTAVASMVDTRPASTMMASRAKGRAAPRSSDRRLRRDCDIAQPHLCADGQGLGAGGLRALRSQGHGDHAGLEVGHAVVVFEFAV